MSKFLREAAPTTHCSLDLTIYLNTYILQDVFASANWQKSNVYIENRPFYTQQISGLMYNSKLGLVEGAKAQDRALSATAEDHVHEH